MKYLLIVSLVLIGFLPLGFNGCGVGKSIDYSKNDAASSVAATGSDPVAAGNGQKVQGVGALSVPTAPALISRITNGLEGQVNPTLGNFAAALRNLESNLPKVTDPTKASGFDNSQLLIYAACSDLTTGTTPKMQSVYNVPVTGTVAASQSQLMAAGMRILDKYTAGIASQSSATSEVQAALTKLVQDLIPISNDPSEKVNMQVAFMSMCIAANTAGSSLLSF